MKNNPKGRSQKSGLHAPTAKKTTKSMLRVSATEKDKSFVYKMPPQQQWFLKGKDKDCL